MFCKMIILPRRPSGDAADVKGGDVADFGAGPEALPRAVAKLEGEMLVERDRREGADPFAR
jgi:hypothetical protein